MYLLDSGIILLANTTWVLASVTIYLIGPTLLFYTAYLIDAFKKKIPSYHQFLDKNFQLLAKLKGHRWYQEPACTMHV